MIYAKVRIQSLRPLFFGCLGHCRVGKGFRLQGFRALRFRMMEARLLSPPAAPLNTICIGFRVSGLGFSV